MAQLNNTIFPANLSVCLHIWIFLQDFLQILNFFYISEVESWIEEKRFLLTIFKCFAQSEGKFQENCSFLSRISKNKSRLGTEQKRHKKTNMNNHNHFLHIMNTFQFSIFSEIASSCAPSGLPVEQLPGYSSTSSQSSLDSSSTCLFSSSTISYLSPYQGMYQT